MTIDDDNSNVGVGTSSPARARTLSDYPVLSRNLHSQRSLRNPWTQSRGTGWTHRNREEVPRARSNQKIHPLTHMGQSLFPLLRPAYESTPELSVLAAEVRAGTASDDFRRQTAFDDAVDVEER